MTDTEGESESITFTATVVAETLAATTVVEISGDDQTATVSTELPDPFIVEVRDQNDDALSGVDVAFAVTAGGGTLSDASVTTGSNGRAESTLTLGSTAGTNTVTATASGVTTSISFTATGTAVVLAATTLSEISGDDQTGTVGKALDNPFVVEVQDQDGDTFSGATVTFAVYGRRRFPVHHLRHNGCGRQSIHHFDTRLNCGVEYRQRKRNGYYRYD